MNRPAEALFGSDYEQRSFGTAGQKTMSRIEIATLVSLLMPPKKGLILDLGTGTGRIAKSVVDQQRIVVGIDISRSALEGAKRKRIPSDKFLLVRGDISKLPFRKNSFDRIYCVRVLKYIPYPINVLKEVRGLLKPHGEFVLEISNVYAWESLLKIVDKIRINHPYRYSLMKLQNVRQTLEQSRFHIISVNPLHKLPEIVWIKFSKHQRVLDLLVYLEKFLLRFTPTQLFSRGIIIKCRNEPTF